MGLPAVKQEPAEQKVRMLPLAADDDCIHEAQPSSNKNEPRYIREQVSHGPFQVVLMPQYHVSQGFLSAKTKESPFREPNSNSIKATRTHWWKLLQLLPMTAWTTFQCQTTNGGSHSIVEPPPSIFSPRPCNSQLASHTPTTTPMKKPNRGHVR